MLKLQKKGKCRFEFVSISLTEFWMTLGLLFLLFRHCSLQWCVDAFMLFLNQHYLKHLSITGWLSNSCPDFKALHYVGLLALYPIILSQGKPPKPSISVTQSSSYPSQALFLVCLQPAWPVTPLSLAKFYPLQGPSTPSCIYVLLNIILICLY